MMGRYETYTVFSDPVIYAVVLGVVCGFILRQLPADPRAFILDNIASPLQSKTYCMYEEIEAAHKLGGMKKAAEAAG